MKVLVLAIILSLVTCVPAAIKAQSTPPNQAQPGTDSAQTATIKIVSPKSGEKLKDAYVNVKFELVNPRAAAGSPNFRVQLDDGDPVLTTSTEHTFTGLSAGSHTVTVTLVDANETPIAGSRAEVGFVMLAPAPTTGTASVSGAQADVLRPAAPARPRLLLASADRGQQGEELPASGSALPLLSVIGFGVLLGGIASALKTR